MSTWPREIDYPIQRIQVNRRLRPLREAALTELASSMATLGLLNRIHLLPDGTLVAGLHRLEAARRLGWETIPVRILEVDELDAELAEIDENLRRTELSVLEQGEHLIRRQELLEAKGLRAKASPGTNQHVVGETVSPTTTVTTAAMAAELGISERSAQQRTQIARRLDPVVKELIGGTDLADSTTQLLALARMEPAAQAAAAEKVLQRQARNVHEAQRQLRQETRRRDVAALPDQIFNVVYADPPWAYNNTGVNGAANHHYSTMSIDELRTLPARIGLRLDRNAVLFLWITNPILAEGFDLINAWGFQYKTNMVWVKTGMHRVGTGFYVRGAHELLLIATRGSMTPLNTKEPISSVVEAPVQEHSAKPDLFAELIEKLYPGCNYVELFARRPRPGWTMWGNEI